MTSCDTNIFAYALNTSVPEHPRAFQFISSRLEDPSFAVSEIVLAELYDLLRNPTVFDLPYSPVQAVETIQEIRGNPFWTILKGTTDVSELVWRVAAARDFPRRAILDARLAYALAAEGVTRFATRNVSDFRRFAAFEVFDPLEG